MSKIPNRPLRNFKQVISERIEFLSPEPTTMTLYFEDGSRQIIRPQGKEFLDFKVNQNEWKGLANSIAVQARASWVKAVVSG